MPQYSVSLEKIIDTYKLEVLNMPCDPAEIMIKSPEVYRPGLQLAGSLYDFFENDRVQVMGRNEQTFLERSGDKMEPLIRAYFERRPIVTVIARCSQILDPVVQAAKDYECSLLGTDMGTSDFMAQLIGMLNVELAPRETKHGVLVEVYGEGILITGESGVGKSETAMELVKRGHRLIADDAVEVRRVSARTLVGSSPQNIRHFMELRGIGIINVRQIFGIGSVKVTQQIDLVVNMEQWDEDRVYDRMGLESESIDMLGNPVPYLTIPIKPGRNLAIIIEVAAMNNRQKAMGYNSAQDLLTRLGMLDPEEVVAEPNKLESWDE